MRSASTPRDFAFLRLALAIALIAACGWAHAQARETRAGRYGLRGSAVASQTFEAATARRNGIEPAPTRGVLNVTVLRATGGALQNVHADVHASAADLTGRRSDIEMHPVVDNGMVSNLDTLEFVPREVLDSRSSRSPSTKANR